ncbi:MAG TPA: hypothetical protein PLQ32_07525 [Flavihumibacter sp.]|nr:hypothetical protein [Bacteroidota bacterium]HPZ87936.1 hypothetical protein [Flavihumibacter sp.]HQD09467.1 hypothetical protein [Flavihumibacter sp.]
MRKCLAAVAAMLLAMGTQAQTKTDSAAVQGLTRPATNATAPVKAKKKDWSKVTLNNRANDHFVFQTGYEGWAGSTTGIRTKGIGRFLNIYFMLDMPFKSDPRFSVGIGAGIGSSNIYFDKMEPQIAGTTSTFVFNDMSDSATFSSRFKKFKMTEAWAEVPVEFRWVKNPENSNKSWKAGLGIKVGTMLNAHTKGKNLQNNSGQTINAFTLKENSKRYFNTLRLAATARVGYGPFNLYAAYQINSLIKESAGPQVHPYSIGFQFSGL